MHKAFIHCVFHTNIQSLVLSHTLTRPSFTFSLLNTRILHSVSQYSSQASFIHFLTSLSRSYSFTRPLTHSLSSLSLLQYTHVPSFTLSIISSRIIHSLTHPLTHTLFTTCSSVFLSRSLHSLFTYLLKPPSFIT